MSREELEAKYKELEDKEFDLKMKDTWSASDGRTMDKIHDEMQKIKAQLDEM